jgi:hypothetical protein
VNETTPKEEGRSFGNENGAITVPTARAHILVKIQSLGDKLDVYSQLLLTGVRH